MSSCAFRRADGAVRCCRGSCGDVDVKTGKDRAIPGYLLCRTFLLCFFCLPLCSLNQWELVCLTSLFQASGSSSTLLFSLLQVQVFLFGSPHCWPSTLPWMASPMGRHFQAASLCAPYFCKCPFQDCKSESGAQLPLTNASENLSSWWLRVLLFVFGWLARLEASRGSWSCACVGV